MPMKIFEILQLLIYVTIYYVSNLEGPMKITKKDLIRLIETKLNEAFMLNTSVNAQAQAAMEKVGISSADFGIENLSKKLDIRLQSINSFGNSRQESGAVAGKSYDVNLTLFVAPMGFDKGGAAFGKEVPEPEYIGTDTDEDGDITNDLNESALKRLIEAELLKLLNNENLY